MHCKYKHNEDIDSRNSSKLETEWFISRARDLSQGAYTT